MVSQVEYVHHLARIVILAALSGLALLGLAGAGRSQEAPVSQASPASGVAADDDALPEVDDNAWSVEVDGLVPHLDTVDRVLRTDMTSVPAEGETRVVIDLVTQMAYAYRGEALVGASTISSGKSGKVTPLGYWPVLEKKSFHRSRKYNNAPMPFMQRLDEYGIALHGGLTPGYPASNGCVRLPMEFAKKLYGLTRVGTQVVIEG